MPEMALRKGQSGAVQGPDWDGGKKVAKAESPSQDKPSCGRVIPESVFLYTIVLQPVITGREFHAIKYEQEIITKSGRIRNDEKYSVSIIVVSTFHEADHTSNRNYFSESDYLFRLHPADNISAPGPGFFYQPGHSTEYGK